MRMVLLVPLALLALTALPARARTVVARPRDASLPGASAQGERECRTRSLAGRCLPPPRCAASELDLDGICLPARLEAPAELAAEIATNAHTDRTGRLVVYEHIPRRPDLPADYDRYIYPVPPWHHRTVTSGYDLGQPDALQRRGADLSAVGHGGVDLPHERGTPVRVVSLRGEVGDPEVLYVGPLFGTTVVLKHVVRESGSLRTYLALHGHLDATAPGLQRGQSVQPGTIIGFVGDTGAIGIVHLHYEIRMVRPGVDPERYDSPNDIIAQQNSVPCDPRNLLPMRTETIP